MTSSPPTNRPLIDIGKALPDRYKRHHIWWLALLPLLCLAAVVVKDSFQASLDVLVPEIVPSPSTHNKRASGYAGMYQLGEKLGIKVHRFEKPYHHLPDMHGTLLIIGPWLPPSKAESKILLQWLDDGNNLVLLDDFATESSKTLLAGLGASFDQSRTREEETLAIAPNIPESAFVHEIKAPCEGDLRSISNDEHSYVAKNSRGTALMQIKIGKGRCLIGTVPLMCSNQYLSDPAAKGNFQFLANWLASSPQPIYFDEKCHGFVSEDNALTYLLKNKVGFICMQLVLIVLVAILSLNQRFGQALPQKAGRKISNLEFIDGLAFALSRARARDAALFMLFQPFKARLCKTLGVAPHESASCLATAWAEAAGQPEADLRTFLEQAQAALDRRRLSDEELKLLVRKFDDLSAKSASLGAFARSSGIT